MNWLREHLFALSAALNRLRHSPGSHAFNVVVISLALMLPLSGLTLLENLRPVSHELAVEPEISVFLSSELTREQAQALSAPLREAAKSAGLNVKLEFIAREKALEALKERAGLNDVVATLGNNPLPDAYVVRLSDAENIENSARADKLVDDYRRLPGVETVQLDAAWVKRLAALLQLATIVLWLLAGTLAGVVLAVVFNTIRLQTLTHAEEIVVSRLLGATDAFVSRPFYYTGGLLGLGAGAVALIGVMAALTMLNTSVLELTSLYGSSFRLEPLNMLTVLLLLAASTGLGILGAALSVWQAIRQTS